MKDIITKAGEDRESSLRPLRIRHDGHTHTKNSLDARQTIDELCTRAIELGLESVAVTDHCNLRRWYDSEGPSLIKGSFDDALYARRRYGDRLFVGVGVELGDFSYAPEAVDQVMRMADFDVVLGSVHILKYERWTDYYSLIDFSESEFSRDQLIGFLGAYLGEMEYMLDNFKIDVLTHLTCPLRYMNGKYHRDIDIFEYYGERIERIIRRVIDSGIAFEINASGLGTDWNTTMPERSTLELYRSLGGDMIYPASDAHVADNVAVGFETVADMLTDCGFDSYVTFRERKPIRIKL